MRNPLHPGKIFFFSIFTFVTMHFLKFDHGDLERCRIFALNLGSVGRFLSKLKKNLATCCSKYARYLFSMERYNSAKDPFLNTSLSQNLSRDHEPYKQFFCHILFTDQIFACFRVRSRMVLTTGLDIFYSFPSPMLHGAIEYLFFCF